MADNVVLDSMTGGDTVAADDIGGVKHQRVKIEVGADGAATDVSATNPLPITHNVTSIGHGVKTVTTAGTDVALAASTAAKKVIIQAQTDNTSIIAVGATGVDATVATGTGIILYPGDTITLECDNLADIFIDSLVNGEGVRFTYLT